MTKQTKDNLEKRWHRIDKIVNFVFLTTIISLALYCVIVLIFISVNVIKDILPEQEERPQAQVSMAGDLFSERVQARVTAYTASVEECDSTPCQTASMMNICPPDRNIVANNCLDFGDKVKIEGVIYEVQDRMNSRYDCNHFDILMENRSDAITFGRRDLEVIIIK